MAGASIDAEFHVGLKTCTTDKVATDVHGIAFDRKDFAIMASEIGTLCGRTGYSIAGWNGSGELASNDKRENGKAGHHECTVIGAGVTSVASGRRKERLVFGGQESIILLAIPLYMHFNCLKSVM